ncbi:hypothetical protein D3C87_1992670 [compost metagenome]
MNLTLTAAVPPAAAGSRFQAETRLARGIQDGAPVQRALLNRAISVRLVAARIFRSSTPVVVADFKSPPINIFGSPT